MNDEALLLAVQLWDADVDDAAKRVMSGAREGYRVLEGKGTTVVFGGHPRGEEWPRREDGTPLTLLATLDLEMLHPTAKGLLQLWCDIEEPGWETEVDRDDYLVRVIQADDPTLYVPDSIALVPRTTTSLVRTKFAPHATALTDDDVDPALWQVYDDWLTVLHPGPDHRVLGLCSPVQGEVEFECPSEEHPWAAEPDQWRMLAQLDSDPELGWMWGDMGMLYWMIRRDDWEIGRFDRVFLVMQCC